MLDHSQKRNKLTEHHDVLLLRNTVVLSIDSSSRRREPRTREGNSETKCILWYMIPLGTWREREREITFCWRWWTWEWWHNRMIHSLEGEYTMLGSRCQNTGYKTSHECVCVCCVWLSEILDVPWSHAVTSGEIWLCSNSQALFLQAIISTTRQHTHDRNNTQK